MSRNCKTCGCFNPESYNICNSEHTLESEGTPRYVEEGHEGVLYSENKKTFENCEAWVKKKL